MIDGNIFCRNFVDNTYSLPTLSKRYTGYGGINFYFNPLDAIIFVIVCPGKY